VAHIQHIRLIEISVFKAQAATIAPFTMGD
jgi:hypothetical protein